MKTMAELDIDPFSDEFLADPYAHHARLRDAGSVVYLPCHGIYGMARHAEVSAALKDWQNYSSARGVGLADFAVEPPSRPPSLLLQTDPPEHDRARRLMNRIVSLPALKEVRPRWARIAENLVGPLAERGEFDAIRDLAEVFPQYIFPDMIGLREDGRENLLKWASAAFNGMGPLNRLRMESEAAAAPAVPWVRVACQRENLRADGWGAQVFAAADRGECTDEEAELLVRSFVTAGVDTTINGIGNLLYALTSFPEEWDKLRADNSLIPQAIEESLRWDSTAQTFFRTTAKDVEVAGHIIPQGSKVLLFLAAANRDPRRWNDPDRFDIGRQSSGHIAFGFGVHQCLGQMVARQEMRLILEALLARVSTLRAAGPPVRRLNNTLHALSSLPVRAMPL